MPIKGIELIKHHVSDWEAGVAFYRDALGLKLRFEQPGLWAQFEAPDGGRIGLVMEHENIRRAPHVMLTVDNLAGTVAGLQAAGAELLGDIQTAAYGDTALIADPSGNTIELIEPKR